MEQNVCYRDVAWLNGDRLVLAAHEGLVTLVSPSDVLQEWDVHASDGLEGATSLRFRDQNPGQEGSTFLEADGNSSSGNSSSSSSGLAGRSQAGKLGLRELFSGLFTGGPNHADQVGSGRVGSGKVTRPNP